MIRAVLKLLILLVLVYGGLKGWVAWRTAQWVDALRGELALQAAINYQWISSSLLTGEVTLQGVSITPFQLRAPIEAESLTLSPGGLPALLSLPVDPEGGRWRLPEPFELQLQGLELPVTERWAIYDLGLSPVLQGMARLPCGERSDFGVQTWRELGFASLIVDGSLSLRPGAAARTLVYQHDLQIKGLLESRLEVVVDEASWPSLVTPESRPEEGQPFWRSIDLTWKDERFLQRLARLCDGTPDGPFVRNTLANLQADLSELGLRLGPGLLTGLTEFLRGNSSVRVRVARPERSAHAAIMALPPTQVADRLPLTFMVNGKGVVDPYYEIDFARLQARLAPPAPEPAPASVAAVPEVAATPPERQYVEVDPLTLELYSGLPVRLRHQGGKVTTGVLAEVQPEGVDISVPMASGNVVFHIRRRDIESVEVYQ